MLRLPISDNNKLMKTRIVTAAILGCLMLWVSGVFAQPDKTFRNLFNGQDLSGWAIVGDEGKVEVKEGMIMLQMRANTEEHTFVRTNKRYKDFILEVDCKRDPGFYYGVLFRAQDAPDSADVRLFGYQVKADHNTKRRWTGGIFDDFGTSWNWLYDLSKDERAQQAANPAGEWDHLRIEAIGTHIKVWLNGVPTTNLINAKYRKGYVAFKIHFLGNQPEKEQAAGWIRNVKILTRNPAKHAWEIDIPAKTAAK